MNAMLLVVGSDPFLALQKFKLTSYLTFVCAAIRNGSRTQKVEQPPDRFRQLGERSLVHHPRGIFAGRISMR